MCGQFWFVGAFDLQTAASFFFKVVSVCSVAPWGLDVQHSEENVRGKTHTHLKHGTSLLHRHTRILRVALSDVSGCPLQRAS